MCFNCKKMKVYNTFSISFFRCADPISILGISGNAWKSVPPSPPLAPSKLLLLSEPLLLLSPRRPSRWTSLRGSTWTESTSSGSEMMAGGAGNGSPSGRGRVDSSLELDKLSKSTTFFGLVSGLTFDVLSTLVLTESLLNFWGCFDVLAVNNGSGALFLARGWDVSISSFSTDSLLESSLLCGLTRLP